MSTAPGAWHAPDDDLRRYAAAALLRIPPGTVKTRAMRARRQLRQELT
jgi:RNA polymerase sigma-70 factor (ECF subfamily)